MGIKFLVRLVSLLFSINFLYAQGAYFDASVLKDPTGYKLRPGDRVRVVIQGEADCTTETVLTNDGTVGLLYIGDIRLVGKNKKEAESAIQREYTKKLI